MNIFYILAIAVGLAMDAFAVSVTNGFLIKQLKIGHALKIALSFGAFQALMPVIGWLAGTSLAKYIENFDHWVAFGLLMIIGIKMIIESRSLQPDEECDVDKKNCLHLPTLLILSIATSIDALAVGLSFGVLQTQLLIPVLIIGLVTFILCFVGVFIGNKLGHLFENKLELIGGVFLCLIGIKILLDHIYFV